MLHYAFNVYADTKSWNSCYLGLLAGYILSLSFMTFGCFTLSYPSTPAKMDS